MDLLTISGIGEKKKKLLNDLGIYDSRDLLMHFPNRYINRNVEIDFGNPEKPGYFVAAILSSTMIRGYSGKQLLKVVAVSDENIIHITFFNSPYLQGHFKFQKNYVFFGALKRKSGIYECVHPDFADIGEKEEFLIISPIYRAVKGLSQRDISKYIRTLLETDDMVEIFDKGALESYRLFERNKAIREMHLPSGREEYKKARYRLIFEEFFEYLLNMGTIEKEKSNSMNADPAILKEYEDMLSFGLTGDQKKAIGEIANDLESPYRMKRLLQGDVGSGKTAVALASMYITARNGLQSAYMAPTEILATQQYEGASRLFGKTDLNIEILTSKTKNKAEIKKRLQLGEIDMIFGTHALITEDVSFKNLSLVVADEQHRFGVAQRERLSGKGNSTNVLLMSATPIPRTLSMILYRNLDLSVIKEMPAGRIPIRTRLGRPSERKKFYDTLVRQLQSGGRGYIVYPLIEDSDSLELRSIERDIEKIRKRLSGFKVAVLHGALHPDEKEKVMSGFSKGEYDVLVSTTVIEVGVDVPEASVMIIEHAERFGLSQLHQLRGRVGRGSRQSFCFLVNHSDSASERLRVIEATTDGFEIAKWDLKLRGPGEMLGIRQHGALDFKLGNIYKNEDILVSARELADEIRKDDARLEGYLSRLREVENRMGL